MVTVSYLVLARWVDFLADELKAFMAQELRIKSTVFVLIPFGYLQRCFPGVVSEVDAAEARQAGRAAVAAALSGERSGSIAFKRADGDYEIDTFVTPLRTVAKDTKPMPREWLNEAGNDVNEDVLMPYLRPLVGQIPAIGQPALKPIQLPSPNAALTLR